VERPGNRRQDCGDLDGDGDEDILNHATSHSHLGQRHKRLNELGERDSSKDSYRPNIGKWSKD
jgi:hypothetical protein